jgi:predicted ATPase
VTISTQLIGTGDTFVGRTHESAALLHQLELATGGQTRIVLLAGEPGIGKTCLLNWLAARAVQEGAAVLLGGASQSEGMPPYLPFLEALGRYIRTAHLEALREQAGDIAATLAVILPELASRLGNGTASYPLPPEQARLRLFEAVSEFLSRIAADRPLLLVLDDLQWADGASLDLLSHAARTRRASRLLIAGAYRSGEEGPILPRAVAELTRQRRLTTIRIGPLSPDETSELTSRHLAGPTAPDVDRLLYEQSEGNPFFAEEPLRGWLETGALQRDGDHWSLAPLPDDILPASIVAAVEQRLARLDAPVVDSLRVAAIIGRVFQASLLANVTNRDPELVEEGLAAARQARLIDLRCTARSTGRIRSSAGAASRAR